MASLLRKLTECLGRHRASIELKWMGQAAQSPHVLQSMVNRRVQGEPLQYILGNQPFGPLDLITRPPTLIPRPETEQWTSELATKIRARHFSRLPLKMLDLCTGSGCIPLLICHLLHLEQSASPLHIDALGVDVSPSACQLARDNIATSGTPPGCSLIILQKSIFDEDFWEFIQRKQDLSRHHGTGEIQLDIVTANPPYIPVDQWRNLSPDVKDWEDPLALLGDLPNAPDNGLTFHKRIKTLISEPKILSPQFVIAIEIGEGQAMDVVNIFGTDFGKIEVWKDLWGKDRAVFMYGST